MKYFIITAFAIFLMTCSESNPDNTTTYWVNSFKVECTGVGPRTCLQVHRGETLEPASWELFYSSIEGFDYEPGFIYQLRLQEEEIPADEVPADGSSIRYTLEEVVEKKRDSTVRINDIWALERIGGEEINASGNNNTQERPRLEFNLRKKLVTGTDGCNQLTGDIRQIDAENISLGPVAATKKACPDMEIPERFNKALNSIETYSIKNLILQMFDSDGNKILRFKKVD